MLDLRQRHLELGDDVPFDVVLRAGQQHFDLRGPGAPESCVCKEGRSDGGPEVRLLRGLCRVGGQFHAAVHLQERVVGQHLAPHREGLENGVAVSKTELLLARRESDLHAGRGDPSTARARIHRPLEGHGDVAEAAIPGLGGRFDFSRAGRDLLEEDRRVHFDLASGSEPAFVDQFVSNRPFAATGEGRDPHRLVFWKGFFREEGPWRIPRRSQAAFRQNVRT